MLDFQKQILRMYWDGIVFLTFLGVNQMQRMTER